MDVARPAGGFVAAREREGLVDREIFGINALRDVDRPACCRHFDGVRDGATGRGAVGAVILARVIVPAERRDVDLIQGHGRIAPDGIRHAGRVIG